MEASTPSNRRPILRPYVRPHTADATCWRTSQSHIHRIVSEPRGCRLSSCGRRLVSLSDRHLPGQVGRSRGSLLPQEESGGQVHQGSAALPQEAHLRCPLKETRDRFAGTIALCRLTKRSREGSFLRTWLNTGLWTFRDGVGSFCIVPLRVSRQLSKRLQSGVILKTIVVCSHQTMLNHHTKGRPTMDWKLEVVPIPVSDVERAKHFYNEQAGFLACVLTTRGFGMGFTPSQNSS
jgi:hypothetical protein